MVSIDISVLDSALLSPPDHSFFEDSQLQHCSHIRPQTPQLLSDEYWIQDFDDIRSYYEGLEFDLNNEPEFTLEAMDKEVVIESQSKATDVINYLDSTAFLSPVSIEPSSPLQTDGIESEDNLDLLADKWDNTTGMAILEKILSDSESSEQCFDSDLNVQYFTETVVEVAKEPEMIGSTSVVTEERPKRRQMKRKVIEIEAKIPKPKANKRSKKSLNEKKERKRSQNKNAANRYRIKKRAELETIDDQQKRYSDVNQKLRAQLQKLQMEFKVVYPLAKSAFVCDYNKTLQLQALDLRVLKDNLLE